MEYHRSTSPSRSISQSRSRPSSSSESRRSFSLHANPSHLADTARLPMSPRSSRGHSSIRPPAIQNLRDNPPVHREAGDQAFVGRDWTHISIGELARPTDLQFVEADTSVEDATSLLIKTDTRCLLIREKPEDKSIIGTYDFADLNAYLLLVVGLEPPPEDRAEEFYELSCKAKNGEKIPLGDVKKLAQTKEPLVALPQSTNLVKAVETFGGGTHRVVVLKDNSTEVVGILTQLRLVKFLYTNGQSFPVLDRLYPQPLTDLKVYSQTLIKTISGDRPVYQALQIMNSEGLSSVAVTDNQLNLLGNISVVDVKLLTTSSSLPLLKDTCTHFITTILSTRGLIDGQDSFPVFAVQPWSTLAHSIAKLAATKSHRMWVTDPSSPPTSSTSTPSVVSMPPTPVNSAPFAFPTPITVPDNADRDTSKPPPPSATIPAAVPYFPSPQFPTSPSTATDTPVSSSTSTASTMAPSATSAPPPPPSPPAQAQASATATAPRPTSRPASMSKSRPSSISTPTLTPLITPATDNNNADDANHNANATTPTNPPPHIAPPILPAFPGPSSISSAASVSGSSSGSASISSSSGHLVGCISLTDVLNLYARASGLRPLDPNISRNQRRRTSSTSSVGGMGW